MDERAEHVARVKPTGFVVCACGWATAAGGREDEPRVAAVGHIAMHCPEGCSPRWVERPGGRVCLAVPVGASRP